MDSNEYARRSAELKSTIRAAFAIAPIPPGHRRDDGIANYEVDDDVQKFFGRMWTEISLDHWIRSISPSAIRRASNNDFFKYYLPSLLVAVLQDGDYLHLALDALLPDNPNYEPRSEWKAFRTSFSVEQTEAVVAFLELIKESSPPGSSEWFGADAGLSGLWN
ncbi:hypothetical protein AB4Z27_24120 [Cupriavidus sp. KB_39]|uniref:hypothetical protein n=1 Tax=Cupriavidus sp. KB_39 TaxID=3233036 RepID=UPI003F9293E0